MSNDELRNWLELIRIYVLESWKCGAGRDRGLFQMSIRRDPIYISSEVHRWLRLLAKADPSHHDIPTSERVSPDSIADQILRQAIRKQHPTLPDLQKQIKKLEDETIERLRIEKSSCDEKSD